MDVRNVFRRGRPTPKQGSRQTCRALLIGASSVKLAFFSAKLVFNSPSHVFPLKIGEKNTLKDFQNFPNSGPACIMVALHSWAAVSGDPSKLAQSGEALPPTNASVHETNGRKCLNIYIFESLDSQEYV